MFKTFGKDLRKIQAIFGEKDRNVPPTESARIFQEALGKAGNAEVTMKIFPQADHVLLQTKTGAIEEIDRHFERYCTERVAYPFVSGYIETMAAWLKERIDIHPQRASYTKNLADSDTKLANGHLEISGSVSFTLKK